MHPIFASGKNLAAVAGLWLVLSALITIFLHSQVQTLISFEQSVALFLPWLFIFLFFCLSNFYICMRFPIRGANLAQVLVVQTCAATATLFIWLVLAYIWTIFLHKMGEPDWLPLLRDLRVNICTIGAILYCFWILAHYMYFMAQEHEALARDALQKKLLISQIELQAIKATTHPHFLYNALNTVASLSLISPQKVHNLCLQISEFLRYSVGYSKQQHITVSDELEHIQNYLGIERERFGERLTIVFDVDEEARSKEIIPLILFPLVENSIKHGIDSLLEGGTIFICIKMKSHGVYIAVRNQYDPLSVKPASTGLGLSALKKRIVAKYGNEASLDVVRENNEFQVNLYLPITKEAQ